MELQWHGTTILRIPVLLTEVLPLYARQLYENMFKPDALYATTHILARDYAKRTIDIALIHHPDLLTDDEREHITPPFTDGGIRQWSESENRGGRILLQYRWILIFTHLID